MRTPEFIRRCLDAGMPLDLALTAAKAFEAECEIVIELKLAEARAGSLERTRRYRARGGGQIPAQMRAAVFQRDAHMCCECGSLEDLQCDHIHPVSKGGPTTFENLQTLCRPCNARKRDRIRKSESRVVRTIPADNSGQAAPYTGQAATERDLTGEPTQVEDTTSSSLRSEEIIPQTPSVSLPRKAKSTSKPTRRCPEAWSPSQRCLQLLAGEGFEAGDLERALTRMRDHEFKSARTDWDATFRNWVREDRDRRKPNRPDQPANGRAARRGVWAEIAAEAGGEGPRLITRSG